MPSHKEHWGSWIKNTDNISSLCHFDSSCSQAHGLTFPETELKLRQTPDMFCFVSVEPPAPRHLQRNTLMHAKVTAELTAKQGRGTNVTIRYEKHIQLYLYSDHDRRMCT